MNSKLEKLVYRGLAGIILAISFYLFVIGLRYHVDIRDGIIIEKNMVASVLSIVGGVAAITFLPKLIKPTLQKKVNNILFVLCLGLLVINSVVWIIMSMCAPQGDGKAVYDIVMQIIDGNYEAVTPTGSYLALWPFQSGILLYEEAIIRVVHNIYMVNPAILIALNAFYLWGGSVATFFLVRRMSKSEETVMRWIILWIFFWPLFFYVTFYYGEMLSIEAMFVFLFLMDLGERKGKKRYDVLAILILLLAVLVRKNVSIFVIAVTIVLLLKMMKKMTKKVLVFTLIMVMSCVVVSKLPQKFYELRAGNSMGDGVSAILYVAMGLQQNDHVYDGYNNGYHWTTYAESGYDAKAANALGRESIAESIKGYWQNPKAFVEFFVEKTTAEWTQGDCAAFYSSKEPFYKRRADKVNDIFYNNGYQKYLKEMDYYRGILYALLFLFSIGWNITVWKKEFQVGDAESALVLTIIGGFIFYILWEGGSRYVLPYLVCMIPLAALSIEKLWRKEVEK